MRYIQLQTPAGSIHSHSLELDSSGTIIGDFNTAGQLTGIEVLDLVAPSTTTLAEDEATLSALLSLCK